MLGIQTHMFLSQSEQGISSTFFTTSLFLQAIRELRYPQVYRQHSNEDGKYVFFFSDRNCFNPCNLCNLCNFLSSLKHQNVVPNISFQKKLETSASGGFSMQLCKVAKGSKLTATHRQWFAKLEKKTVPCQLLYYPFIFPPAKRKITLKSAGWKGMCSFFQTREINNKMFFSNTCTLAKDSKTDMIIIHSICHIIAGENTQILGTI